MKKIIAILLVLLSVVLCCAACGPKTPEDPSEPDTGVAFALHDPTAYTVVVNEYAKDEETRAARAVRNAIEATHGAKPKISSDWLTGSPSEQEIAARVEVLVGRVDRPECKQALEELGGVGYTVRVIGNKLIILGVTEQLTLEAAEYFASVVLPACPDALPGNYIYTESYAAKLVETKYTNEPVIAEIIATESPYFADPTGKTDSTHVLQKAIEDCALRGGGTVYLPAGEYLITSTLYVSEGVVLRGDWQDPDTTASPEYGTVILADPKPLEDHERDDRAAKPLVQLLPNSGAIGLTFFYPEQSPLEVVPYGYTIYTKENKTVTIRDVTMVNSYRGIGASLESGDWHCIMQLERIRMCALEMGVEMDASRDVGYTVDVRISPSYWTEASGAYKCKKATVLENFCRENTVGMTIQSLDDEHFSTLRIEGCRTAIHIASPVASTDFWGLIYDVTVRNCTYGIVATGVNANGGISIAKAEIDADEYAVFSNSSEGMIKLCGIELTGKGGIVATGGARIVLDEDSDISDYEITYGSYEQPVAKLYQAPIKGLSGTKQDVSALLQATLDEAGKTGGIVYIPAGVYSLHERIAVPAGVQLRGAMDTYTYAWMERELSGTILVSYVKDGATVTLGQRAGINGISIFSPTYTPADALRLTRENNSVIEAATVKGTGRGVYVVNSTIIGNFIGIDFSGCDDHVIREAFGCTYRAFACVGGTGGVVDRVMNTFHMFDRNPLADMGYFDGTRCSVSYWQSVKKQEAEPISVLRDQLLRTYYNVIEIVDAKGEQVSNVFMFTPSRIVYTERSTATVLNASSDAHGLNPMFDVTDHSDVVAVNALRSGGHSLGVDDSSDFKLYNRVAICDWFEPSFDSTRGDNPKREYEEYEQHMFNDGSVTDGVTGVRAYTGSEFSKSGGTSLHYTSNVQDTEDTVLLQKFAAMDISDYMNEDGYLHLWIHLEDLTNLWWTGEIRLESANGANIHWATSTSLRNSGENELYLPLTGAVMQGKFDPTSVTALRITNKVGLTEEPPDMYIDDVYLTLAEIDQPVELIEQSEVKSALYGSPLRENVPADPGINREIVDGRLDMFDCEVPVKGTLLTSNPAYVKQGDSAWRVRGTNRCMLTLTFDALDVSSFMKDGFLHVWMYVDGEAKISDGQLELSSAGTQDLQELSWQLGSYVSTKAGWNELWLPLNGATESEGSYFDPTSLNFIRIYFYTSDNVVPDVYLDDIYFYDATPEEVIVADPEGLLEWTFTVGSNEEMGYLTDKKGGYPSGSQVRYADKTGEFVYKYSLTVTDELSYLVWSAPIGQQLHLQISFDGESWTDVYRYDVSESDRGLPIQLRDFDLLSHIKALSTQKRTSLYLRVADASPDTAWGGAISNSLPVTLKAFYGEYTPEDIEGGEQPGVDDPITEPSVPEQRLEVVFRVNTEEEEKYLTADRGNFLVDNPNARFADKDGRIVYAFPVARWKTVSELTLIAPLGQQLLLEVSTNGRTWTCVYAYEGEENDRGLAFEMREYDLFEPLRDELAKKSGHGTLYVKISDAYTATGWGGAVATEQDITMIIDYSGEDLPDDEPTLTEERTEIIFWVGTSDEAAYLTADRGNFLVNNPNARFADKDSRIIYAFPVVNWQTLCELTFSASLGQQLVLEVSTDGKNWVNVYTYVGAEDDRGLAFEMRTYDLLAVLGDTLKGKTGQGMLYVKISDAYVSTGWGGALQSGQDICMILDYTPAE